MLKSKAINTFGGLDMKVRRSNRLVDMTRYLMEHPRSLVSLKFFGERYDSAKSSISEDLSIIRHTFHSWGMGTARNNPWSKWWCCINAILFQKKMRKKQLLTLLML